MKISSRNILFVARRPHPRTAPVWSSAFRRLRAFTNQGRVNAELQTKGPLTLGAGLAFSLIEIMVVVSLMTVIVLGLMAMFGQTQRAFRSSMTQVDVLAAGRATMDLLTRELEQITPSYLANVTNFYTRDAPFSPLIQSLDKATAEMRTNVLDEFYFLTRENQQWSGTGYLVSPAADGIGTMYRFYMTSSPTVSITNLSQNFQNSSLTNLNRIAEGVVHLRVRAYNTNGFLMVGSTNLNMTVLADNFVTGEIASYFRSNALPAYLELELGVLEQRALERARAIPNATARRAYLENHAGQVHLFRQRIPVRNVDPAAYQ